MLPADLFIERRTAVYASRWRVGFVPIAFDTAQVSGAARFVDDFEAGPTVAVESRAAQVRLEKVVHERELAAQERIGVRNAL